MRVIYRAIPALLFTVSLAQAADLKATAQKSYNAIANGVQQKDVKLIQKGLQVCATKDFVFIDPFSMKRDLVTYSGLLLEFMLPNGKDTKRFQVVSIKESGDKATVQTRSEALTAGKETIRTSEDTWIRAKGEWRLKQVRFTAPPSTLGIGG